MTAGYDTGKHRSMVGNKEQIYIDKYYHTLEKPNFLRPNATKKNVDKLPSQQHDNQPRYKQYNESTDNER
jgi:hypothetical protein